MSHKNMKSLLVIIILTGLFCSENITKREGETVVLKVNENQTLTDYVWTYGPHAPTKALAVVTNRVLTVNNETRFGSRLRFDVSSGSMTISNLTREDTGAFLMQGLTGTTERHFKLTVTGNSISIPVLEGSNVTLTSKVKKLDPKHHHVYWTENDFGGKQIVTWENNIVTYDPELRDHLLLDPQNGSLTIISILKEFSEFYCVRMMYGTEPHIMMKYLVRVYSAVSTPHFSIEEQSLKLGPWSCRVKCFVQNSDDVVLTLFRGDTVLNQSSDPDVTSQLVLTLDIPQSSIESTFTCEAKNPISKRVAVLNTTYWCPLPAEGFTWRIPLGVVGGIVALIMLVIAYKKNYQCQRPNDCINLGTADYTAQGPEHDHLVGVANADNCSS